MGLLDPSTVISEVLAAFISDPRGTIDVERVSQARTVLSDSVLPPDVQAKMEADAVRR